MNTPVFFDFKFTVLTPWTLLPDTLNAEECEDPIADQFAKLLCERTKDELGRYTFWPKAKGEAFIRSSFDEFIDRFLKKSEYAVIVLSGRHAACLDNIYPRLMVFLTRHKRFETRFLLVFLGEPDCPFNFDVTILKHKPIVFTGEASDQWESDEESWVQLLGVLRSKSLEKYPFKQLFKYLFL